MVAFSVSSSTIGYETFEIKNSKFINNRRGGVLLPNNPVANGIKIENVRSTFNGDGLDIFCGDIGGCEDTALALKNSVFCESVVGDDIDYDSNTPPSVDPFDQENLYCDTSDAPEECEFECGDIIGKVCVKA